VGVVLSREFPGISDVFYGLRIKHLAESGAIEAAGNLNRMRYSEIRMPDQKPAGSQWGGAMAGPKEYARPYRIGRSSSVVDSFRRPGILSYVTPSSLRPAFFLLTPPHCLKKNGTPADTH
jgi:hypothetical protein